MSHAAFDTRRRGEVTSYVQLTAAVAGLALLIGLANATILHTLRADGRRDEVVMRRALGARGVDVAVEIACEALLLALLGLAGALVLASRFDLAVNWLHLPASISPAWRLGWPEVALAAGISIVAAALLAGGSFVVTRGQTVRGNAHPATAAILVANSAVVLQVAVSVALITCAGLLARSVFSLTAIDPGFSARNAVIASIDLQPLGYDEIESMVFWSHLRDRLASLPHSRVVAITSDTPLSGRRGGQRFSVPGFVGSAPEDVGHTMVTTGFFEALGVPIRRGRTFTPADNRDNELVVVVNEPFAEAFWPGGDAENRLLGVSDDGPWYRVVGVVAAYRHADLRRSGAPRVYWPLQQLGSWEKGSAIRTIVMTTDAPVGAALADLRAVVKDLDPNLPLFDDGPLQQRIVAATAPERQATALLLALSVVALVLCGLGLVAVLGRWVTRRHHEIGIRLAVGAQPRDVVKLVVLRSVQLVGFGAVLGLLAYRGLAGLLAHYLYGVTVTDTATLILVGIITVGLALAVCIAPARRAAGIDPVIAIRAE